jgi:hypothetical protein
MSISLLSLRLLLVILGFLQLARTVHVSGSIESIMSLLILPVVVPANIVIKTLEATKTSHVRYLAVLINASGALLFRVIFTVDGDDQATVACRKIEPRPKRKRILLCIWISTPVLWFDRFARLCGDQLIVQVRARMYIGWETTAAGCVGYCMR